MSLFIHWFIKHLLSIIYVNTVLEYADITINGRAQGPAAIHWWQSYIQ